ncbi:MAG: 2-C-methyl-D-erythritol 4-phosphate cytidylyltransferase [Oscillospiraceae bacterium]|nr:2-C-methyl-D-erythritol 4-phosphate cytidylyltransferase [Oscillospiraceae bacterium]
MNRTRLVDADKRASTTAVIVAAGVSVRTGGTDKIFAHVVGKPVLLYSLEAFAAADSVDDIIVVVRPERVATVREWCRNAGIIATVVEGGADRAASVANGVSAIAAESGIVAIHDGARPLVTPVLIDKVVAAALIHEPHRAAIPVVAVTDTVKVVRDGVVVSTPDRQTLYKAQTPQVFDLQLYRKTLNDCGVTDDSMLVERLGVSVKAVEGDTRNIKITTAEDFAIAETLIKECMKGVKGMKGTV